MIEQYALVTGASQGIGKEIAISLAKRGYNLLLVARSPEKLKALQTKLVAHYGVGAHYLATDLSIDEGIQALKTWPAISSYPLSILVNNAGYGLWGAFDKLPINGQQNMIDLNLKALTAITYYLIPLLRKQQTAYILNVASIAAYQAVPTLAVYAASKAYVLLFSRALRHELRNQGIIVSTLNPGPVDTNFTDRAGMQSLSHFTNKYNMDAGIVAEAAVKGLFQEKAEIIPGMLNKLTALSNRLLPKVWIENIAATIYKDKTRRSQPYE